MKHKIYALYKGETLLADGTTKEIGKAGHNGEVSIILQNARVSEKGEESEKSASAGVFR